MSTLSGHRSAGGLACPEAPPLPGITVETAPAGPYPPPLPPANTLFLAMAVDEIDHQAPEKAVREAACTVYRNFMHHLQALPEGTPAWQEMNLYLAIAIDLARGRRTRKETKARMYKDADHELETGLERLVHKHLAGGLVRGAIKLVILSGLGALLTRLLLGMVGVHAGGEKGVDPNVASFTAALAFLFFGMVYQGAITDIRVTRLFQNHKRAICDADELYRREVRAEYRRAAQAELAFRKFFHPDEPVALSEAVQELLIEAELARGPESSPDGRTERRKSWGARILAALSPWHARTRSRIITTPLD